MILAIVGLLVWGLTRDPNWSLTTAIAPIVTGIVSGLVVALAFVALGPEFAEQAALRNPTCDDTRGAIPVPATVVNIPDAPAPDGTVQMDPANELYVEVDGSETSPTHPFPESVTEGDWDLENVVDGNTRTVWVPHDDEVASRTAHLQFRLSEASDISLVCVVNGNPVSDVLYQNSGRVRTLSLTTDIDEEQRVVLKSLSLDEMQNFQTLLDDAGEIESLGFEILDSYPGLDAYDFERGRKSTASGHVAIAEVVFYRPDPSVPSWPSLFWDMLTG
jgi:hypothetical protein